MSLDLVWNNLVNYSLQIGLLIGLAALLPPLVRIVEPRARLAYWHVLLAACLLLPSVGPWRHKSVTAAATTTLAASGTPAGSPIAVNAGIRWNRIALSAVAAGAGLRLAWMLLGLLRLRLYRRRAIPLDPPGSWSVEADLRVSADVASPVTFGAWRPVVLLPAHFAELNAATRDAILCHEILHVRRKDWLVTLAEETVRCIFWFHPAIWWLLGEIGLAREQAVDREAIELTRAREEYVDALLTIAGAQPQFELAPAPLFLRRRHLKHRVVSIMKEARMSKTRSASALAAGLAGLAMACWLAAISFPLSAQPQTVVDSPGVTVDLSGNAVIHRTAIGYPSGRGARAEGTVLVEASVDSAGNVVDARILSGPAELRRNVLQSVLQWHFSSESGAGTRQVRITFANPEPGSNTRSEGAPGVRMGVSGGVPGGIVGGVTGGVIGGTTANRTPNFVGRTVKQINIAGLTDEARSALSGRLPARLGDVMSEDLFNRTMAAIREYDEHLALAARMDAENGMTLVITAPGASVPAPIPQGPPPANGVKRITIGGNVQSSKLVQQARPAYPALAKQARISGVVQLGAVISREGTVQNLQVISGHPLLVPAALEAVRTWVYQPTLLNGEPVEVATQIDVNFTLSDDPPQQQQ